MVDRSFGGFSWRVGLAHFASMLAVVALASCRTEEPVRASGTVGPDPLERRYTLGETVRYSMSGVNENPARITRYTAQSEAVVRQREDGVFYEDTRWVRDLQRATTSDRMDAFGVQEQRSTAAADY